LWWYGLALNRYIDLRTVENWFIFYSSHYYYSCDKIVKNVMGGTCSAYVGEERRIQGFGGEHEKKRTLGRPGVDGRIILIWVLRKWDVGLWTGSSWLGIGTGDCGNKPLGSIKCEEFLDWLKICWLIK
jgi:hypothetical protein